MKNRIVVWLQLTLTTVGEVDEIICASSSSSCCLDPIPTTVLKHTTIMQAILPHVTDIINDSLSAGFVPTDFKNAVVKPIIKNTSLDREILKNFRPISNLPFLSKVLERIVAKRLNAHINLHSLDDPLQSAYKPGHSTETALLKVTNDILIELDANREVFLILLIRSIRYC